MIVRPTLRGIEQLEMKTREIRNTLKEALMHMFGAWDVAGPNLSEGIKSSRLDVLEYRIWYNSMQWDGLVENKAGIRIIIIDDPELSPDTCKDEAAELDPHS